MKARITLLVAALMFQGCATMVNGRTQVVRIDSYPPGADAVIDGGEHVTTPASVDLQRSSTHMVVFHKKGFDDYTSSISPQMSGWLWGNIVCCGLIGIGVDMATGGAYSFPDQGVNAYLQEQVAKNASVESGAQNRGGDSPAAKSEGTVGVQNASSVVASAPSTTDAAAAPVNSDRRTNQSGPASDSSPQTEARSENAQN